MKFFIPGVPDGKDAERIYEGIKKFATETICWPVSKRKIQSITFRDQKRTVQAEVGKTDPITGETVTAILDSTATFLVCTSNRGVLRGMPVLVGKHEVTDEQVFEM